MKRVDLASPRPRRVERRFNEYQYSIANKTYLDVPNKELKIPVGRVIAARRSRRSFASVQHNIIGDVLWHSARAINVASPSQSLRWQHRPVPSAGGRHPLDIFIITQKADQFHISLYDPVSHSLSRLKTNQARALSNFVARVDGVVPIMDGVIIWFGAQFDRTMSKYLNGESLVWRDAGALTMMIYLVTEALALNCCAVGITGEPWFSKVLDSANRVVGVGGAIVGAR
jgi:SagB-type dehydrogenase family enzyme